MGLVPHASRVQLAEAFVRERIAGHDASHDWWHVDRVRQMALRLAADERLPVGGWRLAAALAQPIEPRSQCNGPRNRHLLYPHNALQEGDRQLAELAALLHDVADRKYCSDLAAERAALAAWLACGELALSQRAQEVVMHVIENLGFTEELARRQQQGQQEQQQQQGAPADGASPATELAAQKQRVLGVVQDADRLDAIGAIGIARCLTFGGARHRVLHDPAVPPRQQLTKQQYCDGAAAAQQTTLNHFHEKLFLLKVTWLAGCLAGKCTNGSSRSWWPA